MALGVLGLDTVVAGAVPPRDWLFGAGLGLLLVLARRAAAQIDGHVVLPQALGRNGPGQVLELEGLLLGVLLPGSAMVVVVMLVMDVVGRIRAYGG